LHRCLINVVNSVGVDINRVVQHKHASYLLQFVSGLGPRKAAGIISFIYRSSGLITVRAELESYLERIVYTNCAGFIKVLYKYLKGNEDNEVLDSTRIHPEDYNLVRKMAADALEKRGEDVVEALMNDPSKLEEIDLDAFAEELERNGQPRKRATLYDIEREIRKPFMDVRNPYRDPSPEVLFTMLTGETDQSLRVGQLVHARVTAKLEKALRCRLDNGLSGFLPFREISERRIETADQLQIEIGHTLACRIQDIDRSKYSVKLTCKEVEPSSYQDNGFLQQLRIMEPYLLTDSIDMEEKPSIKKKARPKVFVRAINHPLFKNITSQEAEQLLQNKEIGELVIRPSSRGQDYLTITWKFYDNVYAHINIHEQDKLNARSLGRKLYIGTEKYEDLDEILARYMEPLLTYAQDVMKFRNFRHGNQSEVELLLREAKSQAPQSIPYFLHIAFDFPGKFVLSYMPNSRPRHEYVTVTSEGFFFRKQRFTNPEKLIKWFKQHWKDPLPPRSPQHAPVPVMPRAFPEDYGEDREHTTNVDPQAFGQAMRLPYGVTDWNASVQAHGQPFQQQQDPRRDFGARPPPRGRDNRGPPSRQPEPDWDAPSAPPTRQAVVQQAEEDWG